MKLNKLFILFLVIGGLQSCMYTFNPGTTGLAKTFAIKDFPNHSGSGPPSISLDFTEQLKNYFQQNTHLAPVTNNGDWEFDGEIIGYTITPIAAQSDNTANNRLTISVKVNFVNKLDAKENYSEVFSFYNDFPQNTPPSSVEDENITVIFRQIIFDIYTRTTSNW